MTKLQITSEMIKTLRERTGVGMAKCKEALEQAEGDMELAISNLRKSGIASAVKKEGRETKEGSIGIAQSDKGLAMVEINAETDFVVKNEKFQAFLASVVSAVAINQSTTVEEVGQLQSKEDPSLTIDQQRAVVMSTLGENIKIQRVCFIPKESQASIATYSHAGGKMVTLVVLSQPKEEAIAKEIAMHIAAEDPQYLSESDIPDSVKSNEEEIARAQVKGKPENVMAKIIDGKLKAFYDQVCLLRQKFIKNPDQTITQLLEARSKQLGQNVTITSFMRWKVGNFS